MIQNDPNGGAGGTFIVTPQTGSATEQASQAAREAIEKGGSALAVRASDGTFAPPLPGAAAAAAPDPTLAKPTATLAKPDAAAAPAAGHEPTAEEKAEAERLAAEGTKTPEQVAADEAEAARTITLTLADGELDLQLPDEATATIVRDALDAAGRVTEIEQQAQAAIEETQAIREYAEIDPVGFAMQALGENVEGKKHLALSLLTDPAVYEALKLVIPTLATPEGMRLVKAEQTAARHEYRETAQHEIAQSRAITQNLNDIKAACAAVLPTTLTPDQQRIVYADLLRDVQRYAGDRPTVPVEDLPLILRARLTANGIDPLKAAELMATAVSARTRNGGRRAAPAARAAAPAPAARPAAAPKNGQAFVASAERRKAAVIPAAGAGAPSGGTDLALPLNADGSKMSSEQAVAWHRARVAKGQRVLGV